MPLVVRLSISGEEGKSYKTFLEKALHRGAAAGGRRSCSVKLIFIDDNDAPLEIQRIWHFSDSGIYRPQDEQINIYEGVARKPVGPLETTLQENDRVAWFRDYIAENLLPFTQAHFFMFDGEQVSVMAEQEMSSQVRLGIEGLLGIPVLKRLAHDLRDYAEARLKGVNNVSDKTIKKLEFERTRLTSEYNEKTAQLAKIEPDRTILNHERDNLYRELSHFGEGTQALMEEKYEQIKKLENSIENGTSELETLMLKDLALALSGWALRQSVITQLQSEDEFESWEHGKNQGDHNLERFLTSFDTRIQKIRPALTKEQRDSVLENTRSAWASIWYPQPENCPDKYLHSYLNASDRSKVIDRLKDTDQLDASTIADMIDTISENEKKLKNLRDDINRTKIIAPDVDKKRIRLRELDEKIQEHDQQIGVLKREVDARKSEIDSKNKKLSNLTNQLDQAVPSQRRAARANKVAQMVDEIVVQAVPNQIKAIAEAMTKAHRTMAHKKDLVERIAIDEDCNVKLLNSDDMDLRNYDLSAGEKQIFTQALISAVSSVSGRGFPMVIDTPLGRLDVKHRKGVLNHLVQRGHQVILLSTNTEVVGKYLHEIDPHVQKKYLVKFERIGDIGQSSVHEGYFEDSEADA